MILKNRNGVSVYFEYMLIIELDDKDLILATGKIPNRTVDAYMTIPSGFSKSIDIVECTASVGTTTMEIYNEDCNFSKIIAEYSRGGGFYYRKAMLYMVKISGETKLSTGMVRSIKPKDFMETMYTLEIADIISELLKKPTLLYNSSKVFVDWFDTTLTNKPSNSNNVVVTKYLNSNSKVEIKLKGHPLDVARFLIVNMYKDNAIFNEVSFDSAKLDTYVTILSKCEFNFTEYEKNTLDYIVKNCFRICNCYPYVNQDGELCVSRQKQITVLQDFSIYSIDKDDILSITPKIMDFTKVVNHMMTIRGVDSDVKDYYYDANSYEVFKKFLPETPKEITINLGTMTDDEVIVTGNDISLNLFNMFSNTYQELVVELNLNEFDYLNLVDLIAITHDKLINSDTGERGITEATIDTSLYAVLDVDKWGNYIPSYEGLVYYESDMTTSKSYNVSKVVSTDWYNAIIEANEINAEYVESLRG